ncbi:MULTISPECIES: hypothetical protein [unclassified Burkholderia]|uniref:hypothetical protein n=1 Tax=unclassified Burkholderia TaxID=2613784 RepID=UPI000A6424DC|nr:MULTISPECIES: hypothetical protein [unclassified Burkholderia]
MGTYFHTYCEMNKNIPRSFEFPAHFGIDFPGSRITMNGHGIRFHSQSVGILRTLVGHRSSVTTTTTLRIMGAAVNPVAHVVGAGTVSVTAARDRRGRAMPRSIARTSNATEPMATPQ